METALNYVDYKVAYFSSDEPKWCRKMHELKEQYPDLVTIDYEPETNDGCICAKIPVSWFKISPPRKLNLTDERRLELSERMKKIRKTD